MLVKIIIGLLINSFIGAAVLTCIDDENQSLYKWYKSCPYPVSIIGKSLVLELWFVIWAIKIYQERQVKKEEKNNE